MNSSKQVSQSDAEEQAALWAARLDGSNLNAADRAALEAWLGEDASRRELLAQYCSLSAELEQLLPTLVASGAVAIPHVAPIRLRWNPWAVATAGLFAAAVAVVAVLVIRPRVQPDTIMTAVAQRRQFTLADGSRVELNANTSMVVENGRAERRVRLANGEAYFIVSKDKSRPFIVETPAGSVRVTGTIFNVRTETATELDVTVVEGSVQVRPGETGGGQPSGPRDIGPGDSLSAGKGGVSVTRLSAEALDDALAWRQGYLVGNGLPLPKALARYASYHGLKITASPGAAGVMISGRWSLDHPDVFFAAIEQTSKVRVTSDPGGEVRVILQTEHPSPGFR
jgi:transmembrane sensor